MSEENAVPEDDNTEFSDAFAEAADDKELAIDDGADTEEEEAGALEDDAQEDDSQTYDSEEGDDGSQSDDEQEDAPDYEHMYKSNAGRIASMQRKISELEAERNKPPQASPEAQAKQDKATNQKLEELKEDFPEIAGALEEMEAKIAADYQQREGDLLKQIQPLQQRMADDQINSELAALKAAHPDYETVSNSDDFANWLDQKPGPVKQLMQSNYAADAAYLLDTFKLETGKERESTDSHIKQKNRNRLASNIAVPSKRQPRREIGDDDFSSAFDAAATAKSRLRR